MRVLLYQGTAAFGIRSCSLQYSVLGNLETNAGGFEGSDDCCTLTKEEHLLMTSPPKRGCLLEKEGRKVPTSD